MPKKNNAVSEQILIVPAEHLIAVIDPKKYRSFVDENWDLKILKTHFLDQINSCSMVAWGTGASANWRILLEVNSPDKKLPNYFRDFTAFIKITGRSLMLTSYDELSMAAQSRKSKFPLDESRLEFGIEPGDYRCEVLQFFDPEEAESEMVFSQETPHFAVRLRNADQPNCKMENIPWFEV
ncbi:MAG: hypothetical protein K2X93_06940 [Candidatus Obscuribacterales bacterium]|nr:hypothetical protein [Candidatus Obscuribacterales bacterium]